MKIKRILIIGIALICASIPVARAVSDAVQAYIVEHKIYAHYELNGDLEYPILSYNDNTYIAIRDVAAAWNKEVIWDEKNQSILFESYKEEGQIIKNEETAMAIGQAILKEYFGDRISEKSVYHTTLSQVQGVEYDDVWMVSAIFNPEEEIDSEYVMLNPEARVEINAATGNFAVLEMQEDGFDKIVEMRNW